MTGQDVRNILKKENVKMAEVADKLHITPQTLNSRLNAKTVNLDFLKELSAVLGKEVLFFIDKENPLSSTVCSASHDHQPILDIRVCAGNGIGLEGDENKIMDWVSIPAFKGCKGIMVFGDSMYDKYKSGDVIFVRPIEGRDDVDFGQCYVVITREDRYIKNLYESAKGDSYVTMVSYNMDLNPDGRRMFPDRDVAKNDVLFLYKVVGKLRRNQL